MLKDILELPCNEFKSVVFENISHFYEDNEKALEILKKSYLSEKGKVEIKRFYEKELKLFHKRLAAGITCRSSILEIALDNTSLAPKTGHSLGLAAYEAEAYYQGKPLKGD